jgi:hypothetical protein
VRALVIAIVTVVSSAALTACGGDAPAAPTVRMSFLRGGGLFDAPFPSADLENEDGTIAVELFPNGGRVHIVEQIRASLVSEHGFGTTSSVHFPLTAAPDLAQLPDVAGSREASSVVQLIDVDPTSPMRGERVPVEVYYDPDAGPFGFHARLLTLLPVQGWPLRAETEYAAIITDALRTEDGASFVPSASMRALVDGETPDDLDTAALAVFRTSLDALEALGIDPAHLVGMTTFRTGAPTEALRTGLDSVRGRDAITLDAPFTLDTAYDDYCVFHTTAEVPVYQAGEPPYTSTGGGWVFDDAGALVIQHTEHANILVTLPRRAMPTDGFPAVVLSRTGAGGDRPLVDRGIDTTPHMGAPPGTGMAMHFAREGFAGVQIDGPHGGLRNVTGGDEQFIVFNIQNPEALRDNLRQSAIELDLLVDLLPALRIDPTGCDGLVTPEAAGRIDVRTLALMGHSMGASIAPLAAAFEPRYRAVILSGAGASWLENVLYKLSPIATRGLATTLLGYSAERPPRVLREDDPVLNWLQWAGEASDAAVYAPLLVRDAPSGSARHVLMFQGVVDTYIMPPIANAMTIATGLDLAGPVLDRSDPRIADFQSITDVLPLRERSALSFPVSLNAETSGSPVTAAVTQHIEDGVEDGHEIMWQLPEAHTQVRCFLRSFLVGAPVIVDGAVGCGP